MNSQNFASCQIGDFLVTVLHDGEMSISLNLLSGIDINDAEKIQHDSNIIDPSNIDINSYLIQGKGHTILVDTGTGGLNNAGGSLQENLARLGIKPQDIDTILITHAHPDHIGGLLDKNGNPRYKNAKLFLHTLEANYWQDNRELEQANERGKNNFNLVRRTLNAYQKCLNTFDNDTFIGIEGIRPILLAGHTPGHTGFYIESEENSLLIWGDTVHFPYIQLRDPSISIAFDLNSSQAKETRKQLLKQVAEKRQLIAGMHIGKSGFLYIRSRQPEEGYCISYLY